MRNECAAAAGQSVLVGPEWLLDDADWGLFRKVPLRGNPGSAAKI